MTVEEAKGLIYDLGGRFASPYNQSDKRTIEHLYEEVLGKVFRPTSCQNCYHDAVVEIYHHLTHFNTMAQQRRFLLKAGAIINSPKFDKGKIYSNANMTDDIAERYLDMFPEQIHLFQRAEKAAETAAESKETPKVDKLSPKKGKTAQKGRKTAKTE